MKTIFRTTCTILFCTLCIFAPHSFAQLNGVQSPMVNMPAAPEASALKEYVDIPVSEYTGTAGVNIPLYTLQTKEVSVPISIGYHTAGNKVTEEASWVGLGWSLSAGGLITREIKDKDDFGFQHRTNGTYHEGYYSNFGNQIGSLPGQPVDQNLFTLIPLSPIDPLNINGQGSLFTVYASQVYTDATYVGNDGAAYLPSNTLCPYDEIDAEPDLYSFNFMGYSGKFVLNDEGVFTPLSDHGMKIVYTDPGWKIITQDGTAFFFGLTDQSRQKTYSESFNFIKNDPNSASVRYTVCPSCSSNNTNITFDHISSWFLEKIETVNGRNILFDYDKAFINRMLMSLEGYVLFLVLVKTGINVINYVLKIVVRQSIVFQRIRQVRMSLLLVTIELI